MKPKYTVTIKADTLDSLKDAIELANKGVETLMASDDLRGKGYHLKVDAKKLPEKD